MNETCKNCSQFITENFCSNCGQKKYKRIDRKYIFDEIQYTLIHTNKGFFYSIKKILRNPGKEAKEYLEGNRINHYKPILLAMVLTTISTFITFKLLNNIDFQYNIENGAENGKKIQEFSTKFFEQLSKYYNLIMLSFIPIISLISKWVFKKSGYNYYEQIIINTFFFNYYTILSIIVSPLSYLFKNNIYLNSIFSFIWAIAALFLLFYFYKNLYTNKNNSEILLQLIKVSIFSFLGICFIYFIAIISAIIYIINFNPEILETFK